ncbi:MAG: hypothetical protein LBL73_09775 [Synergistaceae bacterium]|jgi:ribosomal protein S27AE|nr:hypothetical protein [Synergistaceae bacterium]
MTALKLNRFSLTEIEDITIRCKKCGAGHIVRIDGERFGAGKCPSCGMPYGELAQQAFESLRAAREAQEMGREHFAFEFDIAEK